MAPQWQREYVTLMWAGYEGVRPGVCDLVRLCSELGFETALGGAGVSDAAGDNLPVCV